MKLQQTMTRVLDALRDPEAPSVLLSLVRWDFALLVQGERLNFMGTATEEKMWAALENWLHFTQEKCESFRHPLIVSSQDAASIKSEVAAIVALLDRLFTGQAYALLFHDETGHVGPYISNGDRGDMVRVITELVTHHSVGLKPEPIA